MGDRYKIVEAVEFIDMRTDTILPFKGYPKEMVNLVKIYVGDLQRIREILLGLNEE